MDVVQTFGNVIASQAEAHPDGMRRLLLTGWRAQLLKLKAFPDKRLPEARQYSAVIAMQKITDAMRNPERSAAMSIFTPYEPLDAAGILPYSPEQMSAFLAGTKCEGPFLEMAEGNGFCDTMCSYHRIFLGALCNGMVPKPACTVYTNLVCDGNMITFPYLQEKLGIPGFCIDVPYERSEEAVADVAEQIRKMTEFIGDVTGRHVTHEALCESVARGWKSALAYRRFLTASPGRRLPADMTNEMYAFLMNHLLMGSEETLRYCTGLAEQMEQAPKSDGLRLVWLHTMPFSQEPAIKRLNFTDRVFITACDLAADPMLTDINPAKPYDAMARRMVYSAVNGPTKHRVQLALDLADMTQADGVVIYAHWGCKATLGAAQLMKSQIEAAGLPCLVLDGDGADSANRSDGQTATRLDAFLELLEAQKASCHGAPAPSPASASVPAPTPAPVPASTSASTPTSASAPTPAPAPAPSDKETEAAW